MAASKAKSVAAYLEELPAERRAVVAAVRKEILKHLPKGYVEAMDWGVACYQVPLAKYPDTHNGRPLMYLGLAAQKNYYALYIMCDAGLLTELKAAYAKAGRKLDMGKCCLRFQRVEDLPLPVIRKIVAATPPAAYVRWYESSRRRA